MSGDSVTVGRAWQPGDEKLLDLLPASYDTASVTLDGNPAGWTEATRDTARRIARGAVLSHDGRYRYALWRRFSDWPNVPLLPWVMLNPSTADANIDDQTIRRCVAYAQRDGYGGILVVNLFAYRATDPTVLRRGGEEQDGPASYIGPANEAAIRHLVAGQPAAVVAWGALHRTHRERARHVLAMLREAGTSVLCLGVTKSGDPRHPSRLGAAVELQHYRGNP